MLFDWFLILWVFFFLIHNHAVWRRLLRMDVLFFFPVVGGNIFKFLALSETVTMGLLCTVILCWDPLGQLDRELVSWNDVKFYQIPAMCAEIIAWFLTFTLYLCYVTFIELNRNLTWLPSMIFCEFFLSFQCFMDNFFIYIHQRCGSKVFV